MKGSPKARLLMLWGVMQLDKAFQEAMKDPEKRIKIYIAFNIGLVLVNVFIFAGLLFIFLRFAKIM
jgi:hypothetical protein